MPANAVVMIGAQVLIAMFAQASQARVAKSEMLNEHQLLSERLANERRVTRLQVAGSLTETIMQVGAQGVSDRSSRRLESEIAQMQRELDQLEARAQRDHEVRLLGASHDNQVFLERLRAANEAELLRERLRLDNYPFREGPGHFGRSLRLAYPDADEMPPVLLLVPPAPAEPGPQPWAGLLARIEADLQHYQLAGLASVKVADRHFRWPHDDLYQYDLKGMPVILLEPMMAQDRLEIRLGGCHLVACSGRPVLDSIQTLSLRFPGQSWWTPPQLRRLGETARTAATFGLPAPDSPAALAELNQELASRAAVLCAVTALDRYHLLNRPEYAEQLDAAMTAAGVLGDDWAPAFDSGLAGLADPVYHLLHVGRRLLRAGDHDGALDRTRQALAQLSPAGLAGAPDPALGVSLPDLAAGARAGAGAHHLALAKEILSGLSATDPQAERAAAVLADAEPPAPSDPEPDWPGERRSLL